VNYYPGAVPGESTDVKPAKPSNTVRRVGKKLKTIIRKASTPEFIPKKGGRLAPKAE
jgi:hypothetical protein